MRGNIVLAAVVSGAAFIIASIIFVVGIAWALDRAAGRIAGAVETHATQTVRAGQTVGAPVASSVAQVANTLAKHADAVLAAGNTIAQPTVTVKSPVPIVDANPLRIQGTVGVELGENEAARFREQK